jgi:transposase
MTTMTAAQLRVQTGGMEADPQVPERSRPPRTYPAAYKLRILGEYEQLDKAGKGALAALGEAQRRGRPPVDPLVRENTRLVAENARLRNQLAKQAKVLEVQGELSALLSRLAASSADQEASEPTDPSGQTS